MLLVDTEKKCFIQDVELKKEISSSRPHSEWLQQKVSWGELRMMMRQERSWSLTYCIVHWSILVTPTLHIPSYSSYIYLHFMPTDDVLSFVFHSESRSQSINRSKTKTNNNLQNQQQLIAKWLLKLKTKHPNKCSSPKLSRWWVI